MIAVFHMGASLQVSLVYGPIFSDQTHYWRTLVTNRTARRITASQLLESLEQRIVLDGFFAVGASFDSSMSPGVFINYNEFGDADFATGQVNSSTRSGSDGSFDGGGFTRFSTSTLTREQAVAGMGSAEFQWDLTNGFGMNTGTPFRADTPLAFNASYSGSSLFDMTFFGRQASGLTLGARDGSYRFSGLIYDRTSHTVSPSYGNFGILAGSLEGSEFSDLGEIPLAATIGESDAFDDGFTRSNIPGYTAFFGPDAHTVLTTSTGVGPGGNFDSLSVSLRTDDPTQPQVGGEDAFRGDSFSLSMVGAPNGFGVLFPVMQGSFDSLQQTNLVIEFAPSGNTAELYTYEQWYADIQAESAASVNWEIDAAGSLSLDFGSGLKLNLNYGGNTGNTIVPESFENNGTMTGLFGAGTRIANGQPVDPGGGGETNNEAPSDVDVTFTGVKVVESVGKHFIIATGDNGVTYSWNVRDIEGSTKGYLGVGASLQDEGKTIVVLVTRDDGMVRQLKRKSDGEWTVKNPISGTALDSNVQVSPSIETNPSNGEQVQIGINTDGTLDMISPSTTDQGVPSVAPVSIENGPFNPAVSINVKYQFDSQYTFWGAYHAAYMSDQGDINMLWNAPLATGTDYRIDNIQTNAGAPKPAAGSRISVATTDWGSIHVGYTSVDGEYGNLYWNIGQGGDWLYSSLENTVGAPESGLNFNPWETVTGFDPQNQRLYAASVDQTTNTVAAIDWKLDRRQWQYTTPLMGPADTGFEVADVGNSRSPTLYNNAAITAISALFDANASSTVPVLGSIPTIGALFNNMGLERMTSELVVFITPSLVGGGG